MIGTMEQRTSHKLSNPLRTTSIILMVMLLGVHAALIAAIYQRTAGGRVLARQVDSLRLNVEQLEQTLEEREAETSSDLAQAALALEGLRSNPPSLMVPDEIIDTAFNLSPLDSIQLNSVTRIGFSEREIPTGSVTLHSYRFEGSGDLPGCLSFLGRLESNGNPTLASENVLIQPQAETCAFDLIMMSPGSSQ